MNRTGWREWLKAGLGRVPYAAEAYQAVVADGKPPAGGYSLDRLGARLESWVDAAAAARASSKPAAAKRVVVFAYLQWWLEHAVALSLLLHSRGHRVELWTLPYRRWQIDSSRFDDRRQIGHLSRQLRPLAQVLPVRTLRGGGRLPSALEQPIEQQSRLDVQYTLQREDIDWHGDAEAVELLQERPPSELLQERPPSELLQERPPSELLALRRRRNAQAAAAAHHNLRQAAVDSLIVPNGSILEFGSLYRTAQHLGLTTVTYEFGEQRERMWLAQDAQVMRQPTEPMWQALGDQPLTQSELDQVAELYRARVGGRSLDRFDRQWQRSDRQGAAAALAELGLSPDKPVVLLCTNVVGDSLALDRQLFTRGMSDWLAETVRFLAARDDAQLVVRVHPGELLGAGHPSVEIVQQSLVQSADQVALVGPDSDLNTYDLIEAADIGLVYTSTVGLEMAMYGVPVIVSGATHYDGRGFTIDPTSLEQYFAQLEALLAQPRGSQLPRQQIERAWHYAYLFFFVYPFAYPWHLIDFWSDLEERPFEVVVSERSAEYERTLTALVGEPISWRMREPIEA